MWTDTISQHKLKKYSQTGEEGYLLYILSNIGHGNRFLVDLGAGDGFLLSNTRLLIEEHNYQHILIDVDSKGNEEVHQEWITAENVCDLLKKHNCPEQFTLMSIDLDGNDFDIISAVCQQFVPAMIVCEINGTIPSNVSKKMVYNPKHNYTCDDYYGFSFAAALKLADRLGYCVVHQNEALNMYMIRKELLDGDVKVPKFQHNPYHKHNPDGIWETV